MGLNRPLDPEAFERSAADLLRDVFPGLAPIRGGCDAGMDGAIADQRGPAFPLVSTTSTNTLRNLTISLRSYLAKRGKRRRVVFATSRQLTAIKRRNLEKRADGLGFELVQIFDQAAMADRLYHSPEWCKELLNLTGEALPLSAVPLTRRPLPSGELIGRNEQIAWLQDTRGDCVIVGPPGSGKTALTHILVAKGGLFLVSDDVPAIAPVVRQLRPKWIIVDDADEVCARLDLLRQVRQQIRADFAIVATCWAASEHVVREALPTAAINVLHLTGLDRDNLVKVVHRAGVRGPTGLVREIVDQAVGRPGLAMTLAMFCLQGETRDVVLGDTIVRQTRAKLEQRLGPQATPALAGLALGGKGGMRQTDVAEALGIALADFQHIVTGIAAGGVIEEAPDGVLVVQPDTLRHALVREMFFDATPLPLDPLLIKAIDPDGVAEALACARAVGANVPNQLLLEAFGRCRSASTWGWYASLGESEARWVLGHQSDLIQDRYVMHALLRRIPGEIVPLLMTQIGADDRNPNSYPDHPFRQLEGWAHVIDAPEGERIRRRRVLLRCASEFDKDRPRQRRWLAFHSCRIISEGRRQRIGSGQWKHAQSQIRTASTN